jgi:hypothetical protein
MVCLAKAGRRLCKRVEYRRQIEGRAADDLEHVGSYRLLFPCFVPLSRSAIELFLQVGNGGMVAALGSLRAARLRLCGLATPRFHRFTG